MRDTTPGHPEVEWVLCSDNLQDIVIIHIPQLNDTLIEDNYVDISLKEIKDTYFKNFHPLNWKRTCQKQSKFKLSFLIELMSFDIKCLLYQIQI